MVGGPWAWHHSGHHSYLWHSFFYFIELFTLSNRERTWRQKWLCGCLMPSIFLCHRGFSSVSNPARAPAAPRMASPKAQDTSSLNYPLLPTQPTQPALYWVPLWPGCSRWSQVHTVGMIAVTAVFFWLSVGTRSYLACFTEPPPPPALTGWQSNRLIAGLIEWTNHKRLITLSMTHSVQCSSSLFLFLWKTSNIAQVTWHKSATRIIKLSN